MPLVLTDEIERSAAAGDASAMTALGKLALVGGAGVRTPEDGARLLAAAGEKGNAEADGLIAVVIGAGAANADDWSLALGYLQRAAERGWQPARAQLCCLASDRESAAEAEAGNAPAGIWECLRNAVDVAARLAAPDLQVLCAQPRIAVVEGFARNDECSWMISRGRARAAPAQVFDRESGGAAHEDARSNSATLFNILETDLVLLMLRARIARATRFPVANLEETNVLHYAVGQEFRRHFDFFDPDRPGLADEIAARGQRVGTFLIYLNDGYEGGETEFPSIGRRLKGRSGDALFFLNVESSGAPDRQTLHAGLAPTRGEKWLLSQWIRGRHG
jgi:prolyl 4-hydroxylase